MDLSFGQFLKTMGGEMRAFVRELPALAGAEMLDAVDQNFRSESFFGTPWAPRVVKKGNEGRALLVQTGRLKRSFRLKHSGLSVTLFTDVPYAEIHNEGGVLTGTANVEAYERHIYGTFTPPKKKDGSDDKRFKKKDRASTGTVQVKAHQRTMNTTIPARPYMGEHPQMDRRIETLIDGKVRTILGV
jgi:phage gpG-like protein